MNSNKSYAAVRMILYYFIELLRWKAALLEMVFKYYGVLHVASDRNPSNQRG